MFIIYIHTDFRNYKFATILSFNLRIIQKNSGPVTLNIIPGEGRNTPELDQSDIHCVISFKMIFTEDSCTSLAVVKLLIS